MFTFLLITKDHRRQVLQELKQLTEKHEKATIELESLKDNDPELLDKIGMVFTSNSLKKCIYI